MGKKIRPFLLLFLLGIVIIFLSIYLYHNSGIIPGQFPHLQDKLKSIAHADGTREGVDFIRTGNYANQILYYYYFVPGKIIEQEIASPPFLICVPGLSGSGERFASLKMIKEFAEEEGIVVIGPTFIWDREYFEQRKSYHYPWVWSGRALIKIIECFKQKNGIKGGKYYLLGFSAGAQFVLRFAVWRPDLCAAGAGHASGGWIQVEKPNPVKFLVTVGKKDQKRVPIARHFYHSARQLGIDVTLKFYDQGHRFKVPQLVDSIAFFKAVLKER